jgi:RimJ/RimL family protein N-acetyltransferase
MDAPRIVTERLILRALRSDDAEPMFAYRSLPDVHRYQCWEPGSVEEVRSFIAGLESLPFATPGTWYQLGVRLRETEELVGDVGIRFPADEDRQVEIGFTIAPDRQGRGLGTEVVTALLDHAFGPLGMHRVFASVDPRNEPSLALLAKIGMRREAHFRESLWFKGAWADDVVFALLESEWRAR